MACSVCSANVEKETAVARRHQLRLGFLAKPNCLVDYDPTLFLWKI